MGGRWNTRCGPAYPETGPTIPPPRCRASWYRSWVHLLPKRLRPC